MAGRRRLCFMPCLALTCVLFYSWSFLSNSVLWSSEGHFYPLAEDTLLAACDSVREAMLSLVEAHENEPRSHFKSNAPIHLGPKFEQLQASLDNFQRELPLRTMTLEGVSSPQSVERPQTTDMNHIDLCGILAGKRITMIGGEHIYRLHVHFLRHMERLEERPFPCPYHEFCTHHHVCLARQHLGDDAPAPRYVKPPTTQQLIETESAAVNYIVSDTLLSARSESFWAYTLPFVDPMTGVRLRETYWLAAARKANVVILGRGPINGPGTTYSGNWTFLGHIADYVDKSRAAIANEYEDRDPESTYHTDPRPLEIVNAAVHLTVSRFLPDLFQLLQSIRREVRPNRRKRLIWPGSWYRLPGRGTARTALLRPHVQDVVQRMLFHSRWPRFSVDHVLMLQLSALLTADVMGAAHLEDPWTLLFNTQVYLQSMVLRELLPQYGIVFLPLNIPWIEAAQVCGHGHGYFRGATDVDLERTKIIGEGFLRGMDHVLRYLE